MYFILHHVVASNYFYLDEKKVETLENENEEVKSEVSLNHGSPEILVIVSCEMAQELMKT